MTHPSKIYAPALWIASAFALGIILSAGMKPFFPLLVFALFSILLAFLSLKCEKTFKTIAILLAFFSLGIARVELAKKIPGNHWSNFERIEKIRGIVCDYPYFSNGRWRATMKIISVDEGESFVESSGKIKLYFTEPEVPLSYGQLWELSSSPYQVSGRDDRISKNLIHQGITGMMWLSGKEGTLLDEDRGYIILRKVIAPIRKFISQATESSLSGESGALLEGMLLGGGRKLPTQTRNYFSDTGVIHILAVSGLHIGIVALVLWWIFRKRLKLSPMLCAFLIIGFLIMYSLLVQLRPSVIRATIMASFVLLAPILHRQKNLINSLGASALFILIFRPFDIYSVGFQLSFAATGGIVYFLPRISAFIGENFLLNRRWWARTVQLVLVTISAQLGTAAIAAYHFNKFQFIAPISNLFVMPAIMPTISIGFLGIFAKAIVPIVGKVILQIDGLLLGYILYVVKYLGKLPFAFIAVAQPPLWVIIGYFVLVFGLVNAFWSKKARIAAIIGALAIIIFFTLPHKRDEIVIFNVEGSVVYHCLKGRSILYFDSTPDVLNWEVIPYLYSSGQKSVDILCLPLSRNSLSDGLSAIERLRPEIVLTPSSFSDSMLGYDAEHDSVNLDFIHGKFISDKNCIIKTAGIEIIIVSAPQENIEVSSLSLLYVNFPRMLIEDISKFEQAGTIVFGKDANGWNIEKAKYINKCKGKERLTFNVSDFAK